MEFGSVLTSIDYKKHTMNELIAPIDFLLGKFGQIRHSDSDKATIDWIMGQLHKQAIGNVELPVLKEQIEEKIKKEKN
jgi:glutamyl-tRNA(Gln) amidotransferase subunit E